jgi:hypothetical protein
VKFWDAIVFMLLAEEYGTSSAHIVGARVVDKVIWSCSCAQLGLRRALTFITVIVLLYEPCHPDVQRVAPIPTGAVV